MEKIEHAYSNQKRTGVPMLIADQIDFQTKIVTRHKAGHYIMTKRSIHKEDIRNVNIYAPNKMYKATMDKIEKNKQFKNNSGRLHYLTFSNGQNN